MKARSFRPSLLETDCVLPLYQTQGKSPESIHGLGTRFQPDQSKEKHQPADTAPYTTFTGNPGPNDEISGAVDATKSTIASSQLNGAPVLDATTNAKPIAQKTSSSFVVATPSRNSLEEHWSTSSKIAAEPTSSVTIMAITTPSEGAKPKFSSSLPSDANSFMGTTPSTLPSLIAATKTKTTTTRRTEPAEMKCLYGRAATPGSNHYRGERGQSEQKSDDMSQGQHGPPPQTNTCLPSPGPTEKGASRPSGSPSAGISDPWDAIPPPHPCIQWLQCAAVTLGSIYTFAKKVKGWIPHSIRSYLWPRDPECGRKRKGWRFARCVKVRKVTRHFRTTNIYKKVYKCKKRGSKMY